MDEITRRYIQEQLHKHSLYLRRLFHEDINNKKLIDKSSLKQSLSKTSFKVHKSNAGVDLDVAFANHGRFIEIQYHKNFEIIGTATRKTMWETESKKKKKNTQWYTANAFGAQNRLLGKLLWGLSDIERERIKKEIKNSIPITFHCPLHSNFLASFLTKK